MKTNLLISILALCALVSCDFRKSVHKDLVTGMTTKGDGLSCDEVYLSVDDGKIQRSTFIYGEKVWLNFENIEGFTMEEDRAFPGIRLAVTDQAGDTVFYNEDLYAEYQNGVTQTPLLLKAYLTVADPMHSKNKYTLTASVWDKKGKGTFEAKMDFEIIPNEVIVVEGQDITCKEIYLFSKERGLAITDNKVKFNENIYMIFEGLEGFTEEAGQSFIGLSMRITDAEGGLILNEEDLTGDAPAETEQLTTQLAPNFIFTGSTVKNPVTCDVTVWDKKSGRRIRVTAKLIVE